MRTPWTRDKLLDGPLIGSLSFLGGRKPLVCRGAFHFSDATYLWPFLWPFGLETSMENEDRIAFHYRPRTMAMCGRLPVGKGFVER